MNFAQHRKTSGRRRDVKDYFDGLNIQYLETRDNVPAAQVRQIMRGELKAMNPKLTLAQLYRQLTYECRMKNSSRKIARIAEALGCNGVVFWIREVVG